MGKVKNCIRVEKILRFNNKALKTPRISYLIKAKSVDEIITRILADPSKIKQCNEDAEQVRIKRRMLISPKARASIIARNHCFVKRKVVYKRLTSAKDQKAKIEEDELLNKFVIAHRQIIKQKCVRSYIHL